MDGTDLGTLRGTALASRCYNKNDPARFRVYGVLSLPTKQDVMNNWNYLRQF